MRRWALPVIASVALATLGLATRALAADDAAPEPPATVSVTAADGGLSARLELSPAQVAPGVTVDLRVRVDAPDDPSLDLAWPDVRATLTEAWGEHVVEVESVRIGPDRRSLDARLRLYDEGEHAVPPLTVRAARGAEEIAVLALEGVVVVVDVDVPADAEPAPARDGLPLVVPPKPFPWLLAGAGIAVAALLAFGVARWRRRVRVVPPPPPPPPPHERALAALRSLAERSLPERGEVEPYFVELSEILRTYLEERFGLRAPEQTTEEFLASVSRTSEGRRAIEGAHRDLLRDFLTRADLVKFARDRPDPEECGAAGGSAERFVRETAAEPEPESSAVAPPEPAEARS